MVMHKEGELGE
uniref:Uncharacterized protein n=1 Tax=Nannochloropsis gaditana (strain CCMP526) TaxID=1093141 RepID=I2CQ81_NANGC